MTRADRLAQSGLEHEASEHARWGTLTEPAPTRLRPAESAEWVRLGIFYLLVFASLWPWVSVARSLAEMLR